MLALALLIAKPLGRCVLPSRLGGGCQLSVSQLSHGASYSGLEKIADCLSRSQAGPTSVFARLRVHRFFKSLKKRWTDVFPGDPMESYLSDIAFSIV
jgi:hypothetical protein